MVHPAYVAGLIDGEGTVGIYSSGKTVMPRISVGNCDRDILERLKLQYGGNITLASKNRPEAWRENFHWTLAGSLGVSRLLSDVWKYLIIKLPQAILVIQSFPTFDRNNPEYWERRLDSSGITRIYAKPDASVYRLELKESISILNRRGNPRPDLRGEVTEDQVKDIMEEAEMILKNTLKVRR